MQRKNPQTTTLLSAPCSLFIDAKTRSKRRVKKENPPMTCPVVLMQPNISCIVSVYHVYYKQVFNMAKFEKQVKRLLSNPKDFTFEELETLLTGFGFRLSKSGKTSGSAVRFLNRETGHIIRLHKPHPSPVIKQYLIKFIINELKQGGYIND